jgi:SAM-dependent methyltransferase
MAATLALVGTGPGDILDAGMGPGRLCAALAERGWRVSGVDVAAEMVELARERLPEARDRLLRAEMDSLPFPDESFDAVVATGSLEYAGPARALAELARVLRPGGAAVVSYPNPFTIYGMWKTQVVYRSARALRGRARSAEAPRGAGAITPERFAALLRSTGLEPGGHRFTSYLLIPSPLDLLLPALAEGVGRRLERGGRLAGALATQVVYAARKQGAS